MPLADMGRVRPAYLRAMKEASGGDENSRRRRSASRCRAHRGPRPRRGYEGASVKKKKKQKKKIKKQKKEYLTAGAAQLLIHSCEEECAEILAFKRSGVYSSAGSCVPTQYYTSRTDVFRDAGFKIVIGVESPDAARRSVDYGKPLRSDLHHRRNRCELRG